MNSFRYIAVVAIVLLLAVVALTVEGAPPRAVSETGENWDRKVDRAALAAQKEALTKFESLAKKYEGSGREAAILIRLLEAQEVLANLEFRIAHGESHQKKSTVDLSAYHAALKRMIDTSTRVIARYPHFEEIVRAYYLRAYGHTELKNVPAAKKDYEYLTVSFSDTPWAVRGNIALADFAVTERDYRRAIFFLKRVEARPRDGHYPLALYSLAWAYFNLNDVGASLAYIRRNIFHYRDKREANPDKRLSITEKSLWEHALRDAVTFYFEGFDKHNSQYGLEAALPAFRKLEPGDYLGNMTVLFAKLLRSRDHAKALETWTNQTVEEEFVRPETLDVVMTHFEYLVQRRTYDQLVEAAKNFGKLDEKTDRKMRKFANYGSAQNLLLSTADGLQKTVTAEPNVTKAVRLSQVLAGLYEAFTAIVEEKDPRLLQIHYNLAETLFKIKDFEGATREYAWVIERWSKKAGFTLADVRLKAISSRYQSLAGQGKLPQSLKPQPLDGDEKAELDDLDEPVGEWIRWTDQYLADFGRTPESFEEFEFEASRLLYDRKQTRAAVGRLAKYVRARPATKTAIASASLVLDTYVHNAQWSSALETAELFLALPSLGDAKFREQLAKIPADAYLKIIEAHFKNEQYAEVLAQTDKFVKRYAASFRTPDVLFLAGLAAQKLDTPEVASRYLGELLTRFPKSEHRSPALLARAGLAEAEYHFDEALQDYEASLGDRKGDDRAAAAKRFFFLSWMAQKPRPLDCTPFSRQEALLEVCDRHRALIFLEMKKTALNDEELLQKALRGTKSNRGVWSAVALTLGRKLSFKDKLNAAITAAAGWSDLDSLQQFALLPAMNRRVPEAFSEARKAIPVLAKLKGDSGSLGRRVELMKELENAAGKAVKLPWSQAKVTVLAEVALAYQDFCQELARLNPPKGTSADEAKAYRKTVAEILDPFDKKGKTIRAQADELAREMATELARQTASAAKPEPVDLTLLDRVATPGGWSTLASDGKAKLDLRLRGYWADAYRTQSWGRLGYFLQELKDKELVKEPTLSLLRAVTLNLAGAKQESLGELENARGDLPGAAKGALTRVLASQYRASTAAEKAKPFEDELTKAEAKP